MLTDDQGWTTDNGPDDDLDDEWGQEHDDEYWRDPYDDYLAEPSCWNCNDSGWDHRDRRCRSCQPSRARILWWRITEPIRRRWHERRMTKRLNNIDPNEGPF